MWDMGYGVWDVEVVDWCYGAVWCMGDEHRSQVIIMTRRDIRQKDVIVASAHASDLDLLCCALLCSLLKLPNNHLYRAQFSTFSADLSALPNAIANALPLLSTCISLSAYKQVISQLSLSSYP
jgi:hypothetical protein